MITKENNGPKEGIYVGATNM